MCTVRLLGEQNIFQGGQSPLALYLLLKGDKYLLRGQVLSVFLYKKPFMVLPFLTIEVISEGEFGVWNIILICIAILTKNNSRLW